MAEEYDDLEKFVNPETAERLPTGWLILFIGLIVFGVLYIYFYTPELSGWSQALEYANSINPIAGQ
jgi:hypothetical protein